jgi:hypothetical protein
MLILTYVTKVVNIFFDFILENLLLFEKGALGEKPRRLLDQADWYKRTPL